ncbi:hypothetical protein [Nisaea sp.]|uniref:hypothetical protein n=1 Tax=Nisaea sp. TaxID=2024842 RepID=UPI0032EFBC55
MTTKTGRRGESPTDEFQTLLLSRLSHGDLAGDEKRVALQVLAILNPSDGMRWAALASGGLDRKRLSLFRALVLIPDDFRLHINLSNLHIQTDKGSQAVRSLRRAALLEPGSPRSYANLSALMPGSAKRWKFQSCAWMLGASGEMGTGQIERQVSRGQIFEPLEVVEKILQSSALTGDIWRLRGVLLQCLNKNDESCRCYCRELVCNPASLNAHIAAAGYFIEERAFARATGLLDRADILAPGALATIANRAAILERTGQLTEALTIARRLVVLEPGNGMRYFTYGTVLHDLGSVRHALDNMRRAAAASPDDLRFRNNLAIMLLKSGRYLEGLAAYEDRWYAPVETSSTERTLWPCASYDLPLWEPDQSSDGKILLWGEQGVGDEIWGLAYLEALAARPEQFTVEIDARLVPLVRRSFPSVTPVPRRLDTPVDISDFQAQLPLLSLPHRMGLAERQTPAGWLRPAPDRVAAVRHRLTGGTAVRLIGLAWRSTKPLQHRSFSIEIERFSALLDVGDAVFLPLQYGMADEEWSVLVGLFGEERVVRPDFDVRDDLLGLTDALAAVDVVVTLATAIVPMASAVGTRSVALLQPVQRDWRYRVGAQHSAMLPYATLLWPPSSKDPESICRAVRDALQ